MRFNKLDLNLLVALDSLFTIRSVSRAAEHLNMSQSALSSALSRLRDYFDDELLVQVGRQMELTPRAEMLREAVRDVLVRVDTTITSIPHFDAARADREFRIFVSDFTLAVLTPYLMELAQQKAPGVRFQLLPQSREPRRSLEQGEADLLIIPKDYCSSAHPYESLFDENFCCVVWNQSSHVTQGLALDQYAAAGHVATQPPGVGQSIESLYMESTGMVRRVEVTSYSFLGAPFQVVGTDRVTTVHARLARLLSRSLPITILPAPVPIRLMGQVMQWHKYRSQDPGMLWLRELLHEAVTRMDADLGQD
ncbi:MAG: LysR family transcriptional regulator [Rhodocyclaceae bacterium]|nr:LysR family transcriptional regulator [Rhodocyclaceae bacterium]